MSAIVRTTERLVRQVPFVAEALYEDRAYHRGMIRQLMIALGSGEGPAAVADALTRALGAWDRRTVRRFRGLVARD